MYGAIIGDIVGSIYEFDEYNNSAKGIVNLEKRLEILNKKELIDKDCFFSDDTILTIAVLDSIINNVYYGTKLKEYGLKYGTEKLNKEKYFDYMFSENFTAWCKGEKDGNSIGNGCMMRISPVGYMFNDLEEVKLNAKLATIPSHNNEKSIESAQILSTVIFLARRGKTRQEIKEFLEENYKMNFNYDLEYLQKNYLFDVTCGVLPICLYILFISKNYCDAIRNAISIGGDTDTIACIVGAMAEAFWKIPDDLISKANEKLPYDFKELLKIAYKKM